MNHTPPEKPPKEPLRYPAIGISLPLCVVAGFLIGRFLDQRFGTSPAWLIIFIILGVIAGYVQLFRMNKRD